ncbi:MAG: type II secretion system protein J [Mycobacterium sp.]|uniref:PulJ/GspJ family protein n=1 Tax=Mycobacterium sp. TaxID=1785 RepID=UPI00389A6F2D
MRVRLRGQRGFTLIELLVAMSLMLVVLSATLTSFERFYSHSRKSERLDDQLQVIRASMDRLVRQLRSLANPQGGTGTIAYADPFKMVFQTTDPNRQWVSYCLDWGQSPPPSGQDPRAASQRTAGTRDNEIVWYQTSATSSTAPPATSNCPVANGTGAGSTTWDRTRRLADHVTSERNSTTDQPTTGARPLFSYFTPTGRVGVDSSGTSFVALDNDSSTASQPDSSVITRVFADLFITNNPDNPRAPAESELTTGAYMRNQNQVPTARFSAFSGSSASFALDAGDSTDPEGRNLAYDWYTVPSDPGGVNDFPPSASALPSCVAPSADTPLPTYQKNAGALTWKCLGQGVILNHDFTAEGGHAQFVFVRVADPGGLKDLSDEITGGCLAFTSSARTSAQCNQVTY